MAQNNAAFMSLADYSSDGSSSQSISYLQSACWAAEMSDGIEAMPRKVEGDLIGAQSIPSLYASPRGRSKGGEERDAWDKKSSGPYGEAFVREKVCALSRITFKRENGELRENEAQEAKEKIILGVPDPAAQVEISLRDLRLEEKITEKLEKEAEDEWKKAQEVEHFCRTVDEMVSDLHLSVERGDRALVETEKTKIESYLTSQGY